MAAPELLISALGVTVGVLVDEHDTDADAARLGELWRSARSSRSPADVQLRAGVVSPSAQAQLDPSAHARLDVAGTDFAALASNLSTGVTLAAIESNKTELVMLHACGVALDDGSVIALVGPSGRGKTTMATALARSYAYVTDETVGIRRDGRVLPYRKPLSVIDPGSGSVHKTQVPPDALGLRPLPDALLQIRAIVLIDREPGHEGSPVLTAAPFVRSLVQLVPELSYLPELPRPLQRLASVIDSVGGLQQLVYTEAADVVAMVPQIAARPGRPSGWRPVAWTRPEPGPAASGCYWRLEPIDAIAIDEAYVLLHGRVVRVLDGIGPAIWDALERPATVDSVADAVVARFGRPDGTEPREAVETALKAMAASGLVQRAE